MPEELLGAPRLLDTDRLSLKKTAGTLDPSGTYLTVAVGSSTDTIFGTTNGMFLIDTSKGAIFGLAKASNQNFDPSVAGTYHAIHYSKSNTSTGAGNVESGTPVTGTATLVVTNAGAITIADSSGNVMAEGSLVPVADTSYLYVGANELTDPCDGLFTFRTTSNSLQQDVFVTFQGNALMFSSFGAEQLSFANEAYSYFYGVGLGG